MEIDHYYVIPLTPSISGKLRASLEFKSNGIGRELTIKQASHGRSTYTSTSQGENHIVC
jgi:hypothetical protein